MIYIFILPVPELTIAYPFDFSRRKLLKGSAGRLCSWSIQWTQSKEDGRCIP